jgi:hypothetical protein
LEENITNLLYNNMRYSMYIVEIKMEEDYVHGFSSISDIFSKEKVQAFGLWTAGPRIEPWTYPLR